MPRLIDADALMEILDKMPAMGFKNIDNQTYTLVLLAQVFNIIEQQPTIEERKKGKWEMKPDPYGFFEEIPVCSECGCTTEMRKTYNFCPNCGADMRGEGNGNE